MVRKPIDPCLARLAGGQDTRAHATGASQARRPETSAPDPSAQGRHALRRPPVAFLHTAAVHVETFGARVRALQPHRVLLQAVDEGLLARARELRGQDDPRGPALKVDLGRAMARLALQGAERVMCTCSTLGAWAESSRLPAGSQAMRVDRPMAEAALRLGQRPLVVVALPSTVAPTLALLHDVANARGLVIHPAVLAVPDAWRAFLAGDRHGYLQGLRLAVAERLSGGNAASAVSREGRPAHAASCDAIVLAQASMAPLADECPAGLDGQDETDAADRAFRGPARWAAGLPVLCSPGLGVRALLA